MSVDTKQENAKKENPVKGETFDEKLSNEDLVTEIYRRVAGNVALLPTLREAIRVTRAHDARAMLPDGWDPLRLLVLADILRAYDSNAADELMDWYDLYRVGPSRVREAIAERVVG